MRSDENIQVSVIIPSHAGGEDFVRCLNSVRQAGPGETLVVVDGGDDTCLEEAREAGAKAFSVEPARGPGMARNFGARHAEGDVLMFVDSDIVIPPDAVEQVRAEFRKDPELTALFGSYDVDAGAQNFLSRYKNLSHHYYHQQSPESASSFWAGCGAIRRDDFRKVGGFSPDYERPSIEDIELGYRLKASGARIKLVKSLQVKHLKTWRVGALLRTELFDRAIPWTRLILKHFPRSGGPNLGHGSKLSVTAVYGLVGSLCASAFWAQLGWVAALCALTLLILNWPLYALFGRHEGLAFAAAGVAWNWLYYLYGGVGFALGTVRHLLRGKENATEPLREEKEERSQEA